MLALEREKGPINPHPTQVFNVFKMAVEDVRVVILGQDPYPSSGQALGYSFASPYLPASLKVIFMELEREYGSRPKDTTLASWREQGVFLLNVHLTVRQKEPLSHEFLGWSTFTKAVMKHLLARHMGLPFLLWGNYARFSEEFIMEKGGNPICDVHPASHLYNGEGFVGNGHFEIVNNHLKSNNKQEIKWV